MGLGALPLRGGVCRSRSLCTFLVRQPYWRLVDGDYGVLQVYLVAPVMQMDRRIIRFSSGLTRDGRNPGDASAPSS